MTDTVTAHPTALQRALDVSLRIWWNCETKAEADAWEDTIKCTPGVALYCPSHNENHTISLREVEYLIYALVGQNADLESSPEDAQHAGEAGWKVATEWCPEETLAQARDSEGWLEHTDSWVEARINHQAKASG